MSDAPRYSVSTLVNMALIPEEALPRFLAELPVMLANVRRASEELGVAPDTLGSCESVWIDDNEFTATTRVVCGEEMLYEETYKFAEPEGAPA